MADVTPNRNYERILASGAEPAENIAQTLYDAVTSIDTDVQAIVDAQDTVNSGNSSSITTLQADLDIAEANIIDLINTKKDLETLPTTTNMTYNGNNELTLYEDAKYKFFNPTYSSGKLTQFDETIKLEGVSYRVTLSYTGDNLTSITRATL